MKKNELKVTHRKQPTKKHKVTHKNMKFHGVLPKDEKENKLQPETFFLYILVSGFVIIIMFGTVAVLKALSDYITTHETTFNMENILQHEVFGIPFLYMMFLIIGFTMQWVFFRRTHLYR